MSNLQSLEQRMDKIDYQVISDDKDRQIANLEAKLAESEERAERYKNWYNESAGESAELKQQLAEVKKEISEYVMVVDDLHKQLSNKCDFCEEQYKRQLAEKEEEIENIRNTHIYRFYLNEDKVQDVYMTDVMLKVFNQDKISFCIEQLEKVKDSFFDIANGWWLCFRDGTQYMTHNELEGCVREIFDNQIKELKKETK